MLYENIKFYIDGHIPKLFFQCAQTFEKFVKISCDDGFKNFLGLFQIVQIC